MMKNKNRERALRRIIRRVVDGTASPEEIRFLDLYYDQFAGQDNILAEYSEEQIDQLQETIKSGIIGSIAASGKDIGRVRPLRWQGWAAAAALILAIAFGSWFLLKPADRASDTVKLSEKVPADLHPGGNKAILTLADGSTIVLDSANTGNITRQGGATVIKLDEGQLAYDPATAPGKIVYNTVTTPRGGQYQVVLADGSKVWLNAASSITFPTAFPESSRDVKISGEAYFEVAHDAEKPFHVSVGYMQVEVLGTHFNINAYADEGIIKTTLFEGSVKVVDGTQSAMLKPGQQAQLQTANGQLRSTTNVDLDEVMGWKNGLFYFNKAELKDIMHQFSRWYDVDVVYAKNFPEKRFTGKIYRKAKASEVFKILEGLGVHFEIENGKVVVKE